MIAIIILIGLIVILYIVDRKIDLEDPVKLRILFLAANLLIFLSLEYLYYKLVTESVIDIEIFMALKKGYLILASLGLIGLMGHELYLSRDIKKLLAPLALLFVLGLNLAWLPVVLIVLPVLPAVFISKCLVGLLYSNLKINYLSYFKRYSLEGLDTILFKDFYNRRFYTGDYFKSPYLNLLFSYFSSSYMKQAESKILVLATREMQDHINLGKIVEENRLWDRPSYISFNSIKMSLLNKYEDNDIFRMDESGQIADEEIFKNYLAGELLKYPRQDYVYKLYLVNFAVVPVTEDFRIFEINHAKIEPMDLEREIRAEMLKLKDDKFVDKYLHSISIKDMIYNEIVDYFSRDGDNIYSLDRTQDFRLSYDQGAEKFLIHAVDRGVLGYLDPLKMQGISTINQPLNRELELEFQETKKDGFQSYILSSKDCIDPYFIQIKFLIEVDLSRAEELKRPDFKLYSQLRIRLNL